MFGRRCFRVCLLAVLVLIRVDAYDILFLVADSTSHVLFIGHLANALVDRGHKITFVLPAGSKIPEEIQAHHMNVDHFNMMGPGLSSGEDYLRIMQDVALSPSAVNIVRSLSLISEKNKELGLDLMNDVELRSRLDKQRFDYVITDSAVLTYNLYPYSRGLPFAIIFLECFSTVRRIPSPISYVPLAVTTYSDEMSFVQRLHNFILYTSVEVMSRTGRGLVQMYAPERKPIGLLELPAEANLCLTLRHNLLGFVRPEMPDVVSLASLMARDAKPLPADLESFITGATDGIILVSFGSWVQTLPPNILNTLLESFARLPQKVIFKYSGEIHDVPANVRLSSWLPQNDILGHPNVKLFITHVGYNSLIEAVHHGVPILALPYALDQHTNAAFIHARQLGLKMSIGQLETSGLLKTINTLIEDPTYKQNVVKLSQIFGEYKASGGVNPAFWVEHVIKHGGSHLRSRAYDLYWYEYMMLDVVAFLLGCCVIIFTCIWKLCCCMRRSCLKQHSVKKKAE